MSASRGLGVGLVLLACGCHNFTVTNGGRAPAANAAQGYEDRLHSAILGDVVIIDKPVRLETLCPQGWAAIDRQITAFDGLVNMVGGGVYQADNLTVHCAKGGAAPAPAVAPATQPSGTPTQPPPSQPPPAQPPGSGTAPISL
jgi:hypothetical protein